MYTKSLRKAGASETHSYPIIDRWQFRKYRLMFCFTKPYNHNITCLATNRWSHNCLVVIRLLNESEQIFIG